MSEVNKQWYDASKNPPEASDGDCDGMVWGSHPNGDSFTKKGFVRRIHYTWARIDLGCTKWTHTNLEKPEIPDE